jgi:type IV secretion system protein VirB1
MMDFIDVARQCAPMVHEQTIHALARTESGFNRFAIGVVNGRLARQPRNIEEAVATVEALEKLGYNYSVGYVQVNKHNFSKHGLTYRTAFEPCNNLRVGGKILDECYARALKRFKNPQQALRSAFSCYYSGNFSTGFKPDFKGQPAYVDKVIGNAIPISAISGIPVYPAVAIASR